MTPLKETFFNREGAKNAKKTRGKLRALGVFAVRIEFFQYSHQCMKMYLFSVQPGKVPSASGKEPENRIRLPIDKRRRVNYIGRDGRPE